MIDHKAAMPEHHIRAAEYFPQALISLLRNDHRGKTVMEPGHANKL